MGFENETIHSKHSKKRFDKNTFIPKPLQNASIDRIVSPVHIMAVIVVACKMCIGWEHWKVQLSPQVLFGGSSVDNSTDNKQSINDNKRGNRTTKAVKYESDIEDDSEIDIELQRIKTRKKACTSIHQRFIPWSQDEINMIGNGKMLNDYFDFFEETYGDEMQTLKSFNEILPVIFPSFKNNRKDKPTKGSPSTIEPNTILAGATNPNLPCKIKHKNKKIYPFLRLRNKGAVWADANGYGEYIIYRDMCNHAATRRRMNVEGARDADPFHPQYGLLIEYISDKLHVEPGELHYLVSCLDEEIAHYQKPNKDLRLE